MRILFVSTLYEPNIIGGAERVVQSVAEGLASIGHDCVVATLGHGIERETRHINGVKVHYLPVRNLYWPFQSPRPGALKRALWHTLDTYNPMMAAALGSILDEERPDVVNSHNIAGFSVAVWKEVKRSGFPLVHTLHDQYLLCPNCTMFRNGKNCETQCELCKLYGIPRRMQSHLPDIVTGVSRFILERHREYGCFAGVKETVVYNAYERPGQALASESLSSRDRPMRFGFLGRLHPTKGIELLVNEFVTLPIGVAELWIGGRGDESFEAQLKGLSSDRNDVRWLGYVKAEELLSEVDVMIIPSLWHDTAPLTVLEALAWGLPVVASRRGGLPELVPDKGGWIFDPDEPGSLRRILNICLEMKHELSEMKSIALTSSSQYSKQAMLAGYLVAYVKSDGAVS
jgi:glycosyltransferase involved in cell wall biosynthesis